MLGLKKQNHGFTMVEMLMTISLVAVLSAVATTQFIDYRKEAKTAVTNKKLSELREAITGNPDLIANGQYVKPGFIVDTGSVPAALEDLAVQGSAYPNFDMYEKRGWRGPYINTTPGGDTTWSQDGWGTTLSYSASSRTITSCGNDKTCGNADDLTISF
jgi:prepilin-type N-terminal cleavage/methylation domain-containing protein